MSKTLRLPDYDQQALLDQVQVRLVERTELERFKELLDEHHYLGSVKAVGERLHYVATDAQDQWLALLVFSAPAKHLKHRDQWIGWSPAQRHRRLSLVTNNSRFLILPERSVPNLASKVLRLTLDRLATDWQTHYGHPVLVVETFVDVAQFSGTVYSASGWSELGQTDGWGRRRRDYYVKHDQPKRLFCRPLFKNARRSLQAEHLKPALAVVEQKVSPPCTRTVKEIRSMVQHFKAVPDFRGRFESYPLWSLLTILFLATLCGAPRGQKDIAKFARGLSQAQRRALGIRRNRQGRYPAPTQPTFCRMLQRVDAAKVEEAILAIQEQWRGPAPKEQLIVLDGKEPRHGSGASILSAVTVPSQHYLGSALVDQKTNEIPVARELFNRLELEGRLVSLDALHTQNETARALVLEHGADYLLTVKGNQPTVREQIETLVTAPQGDFFPLESTPTKARVQEINKKRQESRSICTAPVTGEQVCFPLAEQAALLLRHTEGRKDELVALITSLEPSRLDATNWLRLNRDHWGIESGLHQRLDISHNDDRCRVRNDNAMLVLGMMLRLSNSLFIQWSGYKRRPDHVTTTDFQSALSEDHHRPALRLALSKHPNLERLS